ncbi:sulfatase-like hydrolase/transferase [Alphaproteobacteria bacterium]|nr:sulfatase-like hydrolase/transferase [Alphaproteobacteria bacterium]
MLKTIGGSLALPVMAKAGILSGKKPNFVFISIDDLNDWISPLSSSRGLGEGYPGVITPALQKLADTGSNFRAAYAPVPSCSPSRTATLLGISPEITGVYFNGQTWRKSAVPDALSIFKHFANNGFHTLGFGKIFHEKKEGEDQFDEYVSREKNGCDNKSPNELNFMARKNKGEKLYFGQQIGNCHWSNQIDIENTKRPNQKSFWKLVSEKKSMPSDSNDR